jgi:hypothetical protein
MLGAMGPQWLDEDIATMPRSKRLYRLRAWVVYVLGFGALAVLPHWRGSVARSIAYVLPLVAVVQLVRYARSLALTTRDDA